MKDDTELLREYAENRTETAFAELVRRHLGLVYSVALRQVRGDTQLAQDVTQQVFIDLASKSASLSLHPVVSGWLYRSTRYIAIDTLRTEFRRRAREQEALIMNEPSDTASLEAGVEALRPVLDEVISELEPHDRDAVTLRFFENRPFADIGAKLRLTENAARMRVDRALDKLQALLARRGITSSSTALTSVLVKQTAVATPAGLAASVITSAVAASATSASGSFVALFTMTKIQTSITAALAIIGVGAFFNYSRYNVSLAHEVEALSAKDSGLAQLPEENQRLEMAAAEAESFIDDSVEMEPTKTVSNELSDRIYDLTEVDQGPRSVVTENNGRELAISPIRVPAEFDELPEGDAFISFVVKRDGSVAEMTTLSASDPILDAFLKFRTGTRLYQPGMKDGVPVNVRMQANGSVRKKNPSDTTGPGQPGQIVQYGNSQLRETQLATEVVDGQLRLAQPLSRPRAKPALPASKQADEF